MQEALNCYRTSSIFVKFDLFFYFTEANLALKISLELIKNR